MKSSDKILCRAIFAGLMFINAGLCPGQDKPVYEVKQLTDHIYELSIDGGGYPEKVIASIGQDGLLLVDTGSEENGDSLIQVLKKLGKDKPDIIINTHSHNEHVGGNVVVGKGAVIFGHKNLRERYLNGPYVFFGYPEEVIPFVTFENPVTIHFNGEDIRLIPFTGAHDDSDVIVWFTGSKVVCTGALCNSSHFPSVDTESGDVLKYPQTVARVIDMLPEDVVIVPGHSDDCDMAGYRTYYRMLVTTSDLIKDAISKGNDLKTIQQEKILDPWKSYESYTTCNDWIRYWYEAIREPKHKDPRSRQVYRPVYLKLKEFGVDSALLFIRQIKSRDTIPVPDNIYIYAGYSFLLKGNMDKAINVFADCINQFPDSKSALLSYRLLAYIYRTQGDNEKAKEMYRKYLEKEPYDERVISRLKELEED